MNRLISILITLFVIFLIYIWINSVMSKKSSEQDVRASAGTEQLDSSSADEQERQLKLSNYNEQKSSGTGTSENDEAGSGGSVDEPPVKVPVNQKPRRAEEKTKAPDPKPAPPKKVANAANMHLVIAGNFMKLENAETRLRELLDNSYPNAEIVNFDLSEYYTVIAGRFDDLIEARRIAKKVNDYMNIEAYVRVGKN